MVLATKFRALLHAAWAEALVYRAQVLIWALTSCLPLVMLAVWRSLAGNGTIGGYSGDDFVAYFIGAVVVRHLTGCWIIWDMEADIRLGQLSPHLLRPAHPLLRYLALSLSDKPLRLVISIPIIVIALLVFPGALPHPGALSLALFPISVLLAFVIYFCMQSCIGTLTFWLNQVLAIQDFWFGIYALTSGYLVPLDLFPSWLTGVLYVLPFRFLLSFPLDLLLGRLDTFGMLQGLLLQIVWAVAFVLLLRTLWRRGIKQYSAVGA